MDVFIIEEPEEDGTDEISVMCDGDNRILGFLSRTEAENYLEENRTRFGCEATVFRSQIHLLRKIADVNLILEDVVIPKKTG